MACNRATAAVMYCAAATGSERSESKETAPLGGNRTGVTAVCHLGTEQSCRHVSRSPFKVLCQELQHVHKPALQCTLHKSHNSTCSMQHDQQWGRRLMAVGWRYIQVSMPATDQHKLQLQPLVYRAADSYCCTHTT